MPVAKGRNGYDPLACIHAYITYKSQQKVPETKPETPEEDPEERYAKLERELKLEEKRENIAMKRAKRVLFEKSYAPIQMIVDVLQQVGSRMTSRMDGLIPKMKSAWPDMPPEAVEVLEAEIAAASNECADVQPDLTDYVESDPLGGPEWIVGDAKDTADQWQ
ncbi:hypothetical protein PSSHI_41610 [Photobacterium sp. R1]